MNRIYKAICVVATLFAFGAQAASVEFEWKNEKEYSDAYAGNTQSQTSFIKQMKNAFEETFTEKAKELPAEFTLKIVMIDVDLAGKIMFGKAVEVREINDHDFPRLKFYVYLMDGDDNIIVQGVQNLKERKDKHNSFRMKGSQKDFYLERILIEKWFDVALIPTLKG